MKILACFREENELGISEIAEKTKLNKSTVYGLVNTLAAFRFLEQEQRTKRYRLGIGLFELGSLVRTRMDVLEESKAICAELVRKYSVQYGATIHIATHSEGEVVYIAKMSPDSLAVVYSQVGMRAPMYSTGVGKAMLAYLPTSYYENFVINKPLKAFTAHTITDPQMLTSELNKIRLQGVAFDNEEIEPGLKCVAAPVFDYSDQSRNAISVSFPYGKIEAVDMEELVQDVINCAKKISEKVGYIVPRHGEKAIPWE